MRLLAFDTSAAAITAVAARNGAVVAARDEFLARGHAERLLPLLRELTGEARWAWTDVEVVAVAVGPGSFTGLRAGISVARALSLALGCPVLGLGTLELVAESALAAGGSTGAPVQVALEAGRGQIYAQRFAPDLQPLTEPTLTSVAELAARLPEACVLAGGAAGALREAAGYGHALREARREACHLAGLVVRRLAAGAEPGPGTALRPVYLRPPDASVAAGSSLLPARG